MTFRELFYKLTTKTPPPPGVPLVHQKPEECCSCPLDTGKAPLSGVFNQVSIGDTVKVTQLVGPTDLNRRLSAMGVHTGSELTVIGRSYGDALVLLVKNGRLALGMDMAKYILVRRVKRPEAYPV